MMRAAVVAALVAFFAVQCVAAVYTSTHFSEAECADKFASFVTKYNKQYETDAERANRFDIFKRALDKIEEKNALGRSFRVGVNQFADWTNEEFKARRTRPVGAARHETKPRVAANLFEFHGSFEDLPLSVDWIEKKAVTDVKDQGDCGSCWAFSTTAAIEGAWAIQKGVLHDLSEQQFLDCDTIDQACNGGDMTTAYEYVINQGYLDTDKAYPYDGWEHKWCSASSADMGATVHSYYNVSVRNTTALLAALATKGPVSIGVDASSDDWQYYDGGIFFGECSEDPEDMDHGITIVGYQMNKDGEGSVMVKNSWGGWGDGGYIELAMSVKHNYNSCGMLNQPQGVDQV